MPEGVKRRTGAVLGSPVMAVIGIKLLGGFEVALGRGGVARLPTKKAQALLAYLAMPAGGRVGREDAAALLWGDGYEPSARNNLRQTLFVLRKALGRAATVLEVDATTMKLHADAAVDVAEFERDIVSEEQEVLGAAIARYRGDFLSGLAVDEPAFEDWLIGHRERLRALMRDGLARLVEQDALDGNVPRALKAASRGLALDPLDESMHRAMMRVHAAAGHPGAALRQYQICVDALQRELGVEPAAETRALYRKLLAQRQTGGREESIPTLTSDGSLVGRESELARLTDALEECSRGHGRVVAIVGEAGIGKSRLARELAAEADRRRARVVIGGCHDAEQTLPLHPWVEAVRRGGILDGVDVAAWPAGWRSEILRLFPELDPAASPDPPREDSALLCLVSRRAAADGRRVAAGGCVGGLRRVTRGAAGRRADAPRSSRESPLDRSRGSALARQRLLRSGTDARGARDGERSARDRAAPRRELLRVVGAGDARRHRGEDVAARQRGRTPL